MSENKIKVGDPVLALYNDFGEDYQILGSVTRINFNLLNGKIVTCQITWSDDGITYLNERITSEYRKNFQDLKESLDNEDAL